MGIDGDTAGGRQPSIYDAFLSYSHASDAQTVRELRSSIERFGRPFFRARSFLVWHDRASLSMTDALWHEIAAALDQSRSLLCPHRPDQPAHALRMTSRRSG